MSRRSFYRRKSIPPLDENSLIRAVRNSPEMYRRMADYNSYMKALLDTKGGEKFREWFGYVPVFDPSRRKTSIIFHPYHNVYKNPEINLLGALELLSHLQRAVHLIDMRPPGRIEVFYPYHRLEGNGYEMSIILPHPYYRKKKSKKEKSRFINIPIGGSFNLRLRYWHPPEKKLLPILVEAMQNGHLEVPMNSILESIGAYYVKTHFKGNKPDLIPIRSLHMFSNDWTNKTELDLFLLDKNNHTPRAEIYEMKTANGLSHRRGIFEKKLNSQEGVVRFFKEHGLPVGYHFVIVGPDEENLTSAVEAAKSVLQSHPIPADEKGVHCVLYKEKRIKPYHVEIL